MSSFGWSWTWLPSLLRGALTTVELCIVAEVVGGIAGIAIALIGSSRFHLVRALSIAYVNIVRGLPLLVIIFFAYFGVPLIFPALSANAFVTALLAMSVYASAYVAEIFRGSVNAVPSGQREAAAALALPAYQSFMYVVLPQAARIAIPAATGFLLALIKDSSLLVVIGFVELTQSGNVASNATNRPFIAYGLVAGLYFAICFSLSQVGMLLERKVGSKSAAFR